MAKSSLLAILLQGLIQLSPMDLRSCGQLDVWWKTPCSAVAEPEATLWINASFQSNRPENLMATMRPNSEGEQKKKNKQLTQTGRES